MRSAVLLLTSFGIVSVFTEVVLPPINTVVVRGDEMRMTCVVKNNSRVRKWDIFTTDREPLTLYSSNKFHPRFDHFGVDVDDNGSEILFTNSTKLNDAGIYKCLSVINGQDREHSAQLTVLDSIPTCEENFTMNSLNSSKFLLSGDYIRLQCSVRFRGFWTPTIEWIEYGRHLGPNGRIVTEEAELTRIPNRIVTSNLTIAANSSRDGSRFACRLYFAKYDGMYNMTASNVPNFTYTWTSSVITLSLSSSESVSTTIDALESSSDIRTTREDIQGQSSTDWYLISLSLVAALTLFLIIIVVLVVAFCIRFQRKLSAKYAAADSCKSDMPIHDGHYDILPYATSDNYDTIDETVIDADLKVSFAPRKGPLPTPGYSGLTHTDPTAPGVYSRMDNYERPVDIASGSRDTNVLANLETISEKEDDDSRDKKNGEENQTSVHPYIELLDAVEADNDAEECKRISDSDIPSSYITVNF